MLSKVNIVVDTLYVSEVMDVILKDEASLAKKKMNLSSSRQDIGVKFNSSLVGEESWRWLESLWFCDSLGETSQYIFAFEKNKYSDRHALEPKLVQERKTDSSSTWQSKVLWTPCHPTPPWLSVRDCRLHLSSLTSISERIRWGISVGWDSLVSFEKSHDKSRWWLERHTSCNLWDNLWERKDRLNFLNHAIIFRPENDPSPPQEWLFHPKTSWRRFEVKNPKWDADTSEVTTEYEFLICSEAWIIFITQSILSNRQRTPNPGFETNNTVWNYNSSSTLFQNQVKRRHGSIGRMYCSLWTPGQGIPYSKSVFVSILLSRVF